MPTADVQLQDECSIDAAYDIIVASCVITAVGILLNCLLFIIILLCAAIQRQRIKCKNEPGYYSYARCARSKRPQQQSPPPLPPTNWNPQDHPPQKQPQHQRYDNVKGGLLHQRQKFEKQKNTSDNQVDVTIHQSCTSICSGPVRDTCNTADDFYVNVTGLDVKKGNK